MQHGIRLQLRFRDPYHPLPCSPPAATVYVTEQGLSQVHVYLESGVDAMPPITVDLSAPGGIYASPSLGIYVDTGYTLRVDCWTLDGTSHAIVVNVTALCLGLFVDINDFLYCSLAAKHRVLRMSPSPSA